MSDLHTVLPHFPTAKFTHLLRGLEKHRVTTTELLTLDVSEIGKRAQLPLLDLKRFSAAVLNALHVDLGADGVPDANNKPPQDATDRTTSTIPSPLRTSLTTPPPATISTLTPALDSALNGGIPTGYITEITGESGAGKTQLLLSLLLASQLPPPHGTGRPALYISTEAPLNTTRLNQILTHNPVLATAVANGAKPPSLDGIATIPTPDLESQEHILTYQVPVFAAQKNIGLLVIDSVAANYRAEYDRNAPSLKTPNAKSEGGDRGGANLAARAAELARLGMQLRNLAQKLGMAVVVANQVADRFFKGGGPDLGVPLPVMTQESPLARKRAPSTPMAGAQKRARGEGGDENLVAGEVPASSRAAPPAAPDLEPGPSPPRPPASMQSEARGYTYGREEQGSEPHLSLDHQQRWFSGWGDDPHHSGVTGGLKTPSLGVVWSTQVAIRIALLKGPVLGGAAGGGKGGVLRSWRRWMKVVYAPHAKGSGTGVEGAVEYEIWNGGLRALEDVDEDDAQH